MWYPNLFPRDTMMTDNNNGMKLKLIVPLASLAILICICAFIGCVGGGNIVVTSPEVKSSIRPINPIIKVYLENSGSMDGYMCNGSQLKDAVYEYVSDLSGVSDRIELNYINNQIIPFKGSLSSYIKTLTPLSFKVAGGNRSNSDMSAMIESVMKEITDSTVAIFISDCILDLPVNDDSQKFLEQCRISIKNAINEGRKQVPDLGVEILKLKSDFTGKYFYPNGSVEMLDSVQRPYYMWIFGNSNILANLNNQVPLSSLDKYGLEGVVAFAKEIAVPYTISNKSLTSNVIKAIEGDYLLTIRADFSATLQPDATLQNSSNYSFVNPSLKIETIQPIIDKNSPYTHYITILIPNGTTIAQDRLTLNSPKLPSWVENSNDDTGRDIKNNLSKTTGIKPLIEGVYGSYNKAGKNKNNATSFTFTVTRK